MNSIIIVTYNSASYIRDCLTPLAGQSDLEIVVVDNNSKDGCQDIVQREFSFTKFISLEENIGFGAACNVGVRASSGEHILFLNPDAVALPEAYRQLWSFLAGKSQIGIVGGRLIDPSGVPLQSMGDRPSLIGQILDKPLGVLSRYVPSEGRCRKILGSLSSKFRLPVKPDRVVWVSGAALGCRRTCLDEIGGFDEKFFLYYEDVDLCVRAAQAGWEIWHVPQAIIQHRSGASFQGNRVLQKQIFYENQKYFFQKHSSRLATVILHIVQRANSLLGLYRISDNEKISKVS